MASLLWGPNAVYACAAALVAALSAWFFARAVRRRESWPRTVAWAVSGMAGGASLVMLSRVFLGREGWSASWLWAGAGALAGLAAAATGTWTGRRAGTSPAAWFAFGAVAGLAATILMELPEFARQGASVSWRWWRMSLWLAIVPFVGAMAGGWMALWIASAVPRIRQRLGEAPPPRGNWRQFSLRSLFELVLVVAVAMSMVSFDREHRGAVALERLEAEVVAAGGPHDWLSVGTCESALREVLSTGNASQAAAMLNEHLDSDNPYVRAKAFYLLHPLARDAPARFVAALKGKDLAVSDVYALTSAEAAGEPLLCDALTHPDKRIQAAALSALSRLYGAGTPTLSPGPPNLTFSPRGPLVARDIHLTSSIVTPVIEMLASSESAGDRAQCAWLLARIAPDRQETVDALVRACNDKYYIVRAAATDALRRIRPSAVPAEASGTESAPGTQAK